MGIPSHRKYAAEGGPVLRECFALIRDATTRPAREVSKLVDAVLFNIIIGNADAHAKNYSLLYADGAAGIILAPLYDLVATLAWEELSPRFAMKFGGKKTLEEIETRHFDQFAEEAGLSAPFVKRRAQELADTVEDKLD
ncbi:HipA domain-containing protein [Parasphingorhabdus halotolerans]|uniref:HipA domain-containing protein n=1 Tax=Parasphingorhabdus halotolerans TaxID=2725558 RepID=UPI001FEBA1F5|nr:HipA domain-containing protein [Parasphingorhabdus halotolerans]